MLLPGIFSTPLVTDANIRHASQVNQAPASATSYPKQNQSNGIVSKKPHVDQSPVTIVHTPVKPISIRRVPINDSNMRLKYTYGINAWRQWVAQKNAEIQLAADSANLRGRLKLFKLEILHCTPEELNYYLCLFVKEIQKPTGEKYAYDSIYYLCLGEFGELSWSGFNYSRLPYI